MVSSRASSLEIVEEVPIAELIEEKVLKPSEEIFIDQGLPIPDSYDIDAIRALVQDPFHIWIYWDLLDNTVNQLYSVFSEEAAAQFRPVLKVNELTLDHTTFIEIEKKGSYWLSVFPDRRYRIEIGLRSPDRGYIRLLEADEVRTPRGTISVELPEEPQFQTSTGEFTEILQISGFASFTGVTAPERVLSSLPSEVAEMIAVAAAGEELTEDQISMLPARIRSLLMEMHRHGEDELTGLALLHLLPEYLRESMHEAGVTVIDRFHPQHITPRFMVGASESLHKPGPWMPSMREQSRAFPR